MQTLLLFQTVHCLYSMRLKIKTVHFWATAQLETSYERQIGFSQQIGTWQQKIAVIAHVNFKEDAQPTLNIVCKKRSAIGALTIVKAREIAYMICVLQVLLSQNYSQIQKTINCFAGCGRTLVPNLCLQRHSVSFYCSTTAAQVICKLKQGCV